MGRPTALARVITLVISGIYSTVLFVFGFELPGWWRFFVSFLPTLAVLGVVVWDLWGVAGTGCSATRPSPRSARSMGD